jgi:hypothetical protein
MPGNPKGNPNTEWVKGVSGNPRGRPKGSKNKLFQIRTDWLAAYQKGGGVALFEKLIVEDLSTFIKLGVSMLPKEMDVEVDGKLEVSWIGESNDPVQTP